MPITYPKVNKALVNPTIIAIKSAGFHRVCLSEEGRGKTFKNNVHPARVKLKGVWGELITVEPDNE